MLPCGLGFEPRKEFSGCQTSPSKRRKRRCHSPLCLRTGEGKSSWVQGDPGLKKSSIKKEFDGTVYYVYDVLSYACMRVFMCVCSNEAVFVSIKREGCIITDGNDSV